MEKEKGRGAERIVAPAEREDVRVAASRCPYCRESVPRTEGLACRDCLARHHTACWDEAPRCGSCSSAHALRTVAEPPARAPRCNKENCQTDALEGHPLCRLHVVHGRNLFRFQAWCCVIAWFVLIGVAYYDDGPGFAAFMAAGAAPLLVGPAALSFWWLRRMPPLPPEPAP